MDNILLAILVGFMLIVAILVIVSGKNDARKCEKEWNKKEDGYIFMSSRYYVGGFEIASFNNKKSYNKFAENDFHWWLDIQENFDGAIDENWDDSILPKFIERQKIIFEKRFNLECKEKNIVFPNFEERECAFRDKWNEIQDKALTFWGTIISNPASLIENC